MSDNAHRYLDGDISRAGVPIPEQEALREMDAAIAATRSWVRAQDVPDLTSRVMSALADEGVAHGVNANPASAALVDGLAEGSSATSASAKAAPSALPSGYAAIARAVRWVWAPRPITVRPALAGAFALAVLTALVWPNPTPPPMSSTAEVEGTAAVAPPSPVYIQFRLDAANASNVALAGTFTEWQPTYSLHESGPGVWTVTVPLEPGVHDYLFIVDGERWVPDPAATPVDDGFGGTNSRLLLSAPQSEA